MTEPAQYDPGDVAEIDQLGARTRDLLGAFGLDLVATTSPEEEWVATLTAEELMDALLKNAANITSAGHLWTIVAARTRAGDIAAHFVEVKAGS